MMDLYRIYLFCSLTNSVFVERGTHEGATGYWFADNRTQSRCFLTGDEIERALHNGSRDIREVGAQRCRTTAVALAG